MIPSLKKPYRPLWDWFAFRIAEIISPRWFFGHKVLIDPVQWHCRCGQTMHSYAPNDKQAWATCAWCGSSHGAVPDWAQGRPT